MLAPLMRTADSIVYTDQATPRNTEICVTSRRHVAGYDPETHTAAVESDRDEEHHTAAARPPRLVQSGLNHRPHEADNDRRDEGVRLKPHQQLIHLIPPSPRPRAPR